MFLQAIGPQISIKYPLLWGSENADEDEDTDLPTLIFTLNQIIYHTI
jgi:hypothetical protein